MSKQLVLAVPLACGIVGLAVDRQAVSEPQAPAVPQTLPQFFDFQVSQLQLPQAAGAAFDTAVSLGGEPYVLNLEPSSVRSADFQLLVDHGDGELVPVEPEPPATFRGSVAGEPGSIVAASLRGGELWAQIVLPDGNTWHVEPLSQFTVAAVPAGSHVVYRDEDSIPPDKACGVDEPSLPGFDQGVPDAQRVGSGLQITELACDADVEYWLDNGSDVQATMADIENVINSVGATTYEPQLSMTFEVTTIVVRTGDINSDSYSSSICGTLLSQFKGEWDDAPEVFIRRDVAQLFTGRNLSDCLGIAYLATVCESPNFGFGYSVVESQSGGLNFALRVGLSAHEIGHNFNAAHCCGGCSGCNGCRIMCPCIGGCSGIVTSFGSSAVSSISSYIASQSCFHNLPLPLDPPFFDDFPNSALNADNWIYADGVLVNSNADNEPSAPNSMNLDATGAGEYQDNEVRTNFVNLSGRGGQGFFVEFYTQHKGVESGERLMVDYWAGAAFDRWEPLTTVTSDGNDQTTFTQHVINLDGLDPTPFHSEFRLRFRSDVDQANDDWYVDDVFVGGAPPPINDECIAALPVSEGSFGFSTLTATTDGFATFCDGGGGTGNFVNDVWFLYSPSCNEETATFSVCNDADYDTRLAVYLFQGSCPPNSPIVCSDDAEGCGTTSQVELVVLDVLQYLVRVGGTSGGGTGTLTISCGTDCPADLDGDNEVGIGDFLIILGAWGTPDGDVTGDGDTDIEDFLVVLANWGPCGQ